MTKLKARRLTTAMLAGFVAALVLAGVITGLDASQLAPGGSNGLVVWSLSVVTGIATASFAWSFSAGDRDEQAHSEPHHQVTCPFCGGLNYDDWRLCPHCGERIDEAPAEVRHSVVG